LTTLNKIESILKELDEIGDDPYDWKQNQDLMMELKDVFESSKIGEKKVSVSKQYHSVHGKTEEWADGMKTLFTCFEDSKTHKEMCELTFDGYRFLKALVEYPELVKEAKELNKMWDSITRNDAFLTHKPFSKTEIKINKAMNDLVRWVYPYSKFGRAALEEAGLKGFHVKRFFGGDYLYVRIRKDGTVRVSESELPSWAIGYLIGKKGKRAKELGIRVTVTP